MAQDDDLDGLIERVDPDRWLASRFIADPAGRADVIVLYAFDHELARAPRAVSNGLMGEIRLTWWREVLDEIFEDRPVRQHPTAQALARVVRRHSLPREPLEAMLDARYDELGGARPQDEAAFAWADAVGGGAMRLAAVILDPLAPGDATVAAGRLFGLGRLGVSDTGLAGIRAEARRQAKALSVAAFAAVLPAALAGRHSESDVAKRLRLTWAAATGRL